MKYVMKIQHMLCLLLVAMTTSCSIDVDLCEDGHPHQAVLDLHYNWVNVPEDAENPDNMYFMAYRPIHSLRYNYQTTTLPSNNTAKLLAGPDEQIDDLLLLHGGEYRYFCFSASAEMLEEEQDYFTMTPVDPFDSIWITMKPIPSLDLYPNSGFAEWEDHNQYSQHLFGMDNMPVYSATGEVTIPLQANYETTKVPLTITPKPASQKINIIYHCRKKDQGIRVDRILAEMSGVPNQMQISSRKVKVDKTYKVVFEPTFAPEGDEAAEDFRVEGHIFVPGLVGSAYSATLQGPGILQTAIYITYTDDEGRELHRTLHASINLYHTIMANPSLRYTIDGNVVQTQQELTYEIYDVLELTRDKIEVSGGVGKDQWKDNTPIRVDQDKE